MADKKATGSYAGKITNSGSQTVAAVFTQPKSKKGTKVTGKDLRSGK